METVIERCCGLDVHQGSVVACIIVTDQRRKPRREIRTFGTMTKDLEALRQWLESEGITHVAMESTGVYWRPVYNLLHGSFALIVANAHHIKTVPGRKTDVKDAEWIANLLRHGLINASYVPTPEIAELRDLTRYRRKLVGTASAERNRTLKLLETANIKLATVAADVFGVSGLAMLRALALGATTAEETADLARGRMRRKLAPLAAALDGRITEHHRFLLTVALGRLDAIERDIALLDERIAAKVAPYDRQIGLLMQIPGVDRLSAIAVIAEVGVDLSHWATARKLAAWAGLCPGNYESAGRAKGSGIRRGNVHLKAALYVAASAAARQRGSYLKDKYHRLRARRGARRAGVAIAHKIIVSAWYILTREVPYQDLGGTYLDRLAEHRVTRNLIRRLQGLGYQVTLNRAA
jgi:transposase